MAFTAIMKVQQTDGVPTKAEQFVKVERSLNQEGGVVRRVMKVEPSVMNQEGGVVRRAMKVERSVMKQEVGVLRRAMKVERSVMKQEGGVVRRVKLVKPFFKKEGIMKVREGILKIVKKRSTPSHVAKGRLRLFQVYAGRREKTSGGLKKEDIGRNKRGRYVSLKQSAHGHKFYKNVKGWNIAFRSARTQLNCHGFVAINGRTLMGQALYCRMKKLHVREGEEGQKVKADPNVVKCEAHSTTGQIKAELHPATADPTSAPQTSETAAAPAAEPAAAAAAEPAAPMDVVSDAVPAASE